MRSLQEWDRLISGKKPSAIAELILADLIGYRKTSLKRADDADNLAVCIAAIRMHIPQEGEQ